MRPAKVCKFDVLFARLNRGCVTMSSVNLFAFAAFTDYDEWRMPLPARKCHAHAGNLGCERNLTFRPV